MKKLSAKEEINFFRELQADPIAEKTYISLRDSFNVLQACSQMLIGLVTICLTRCTPTDHPRILIKNS